MRNRKYTIDVFSGNGIDDAIRGLEEFKTWMNDRSKILIQKAAELGMSVARIGFDNAEYDGDKGSIDVTIDSRGENAKAVVATGDTVLFIEFGTGVTYPDNHPEKPSGIVGRGEYGKKHGKQYTWGFYGENTGSNGKFAVSKKTGKEKIPHVVLTHGNPASMSMYNARKEIEQNITDLVREAFEL